MSVPVLHMEETWRGKSFSGETLTGTEWERCVFTECRFEGADLSRTLLADCRFERCVLSLVRLEETVLRDVSWGESRLMGLCFGDCAPFGFKVDFVASQLDNCSFARLKMPAVRFEACRLRECFFGSCELTAARFVDSSLPETLFEGCDLRQADFRTAVDWTLDPRTNLVTGACFSEGNLAGLLRGFDLVIE